MLVLAGCLFGLAGLVPAGAHAEDYQVAEVYSGLRNRLLATNPREIRLEDAGEVWAVLMEIGTAKGVATFVAVADGTVSMYATNGAAIIGLGAYPGPQRASRALLAEAQPFARKAQPVTSYPLPKPDFTRFYLLTGGGVLTAEVGQEDLRSGRHDFSRLYRKGDDLITEIRKVGQ